MKTFEIPEIYKSNIIGKIKQVRRQKDKLKKDLSPTVLDFGAVRFFIARHFGFCYGVENAIEIAYKTINENPGKRIFLLSEMIHNPEVNADLLSRGMQFLMDTKGNQLIDWAELRPDDAVIVPAFGTTLEIQAKLESLGINPYQYDTTCPFVEKVWNRAGQIGERGYTIVVHGKPGHEETRATFSHSQEKAPTLVVKDLKQANILAKYIRKELPKEQFFQDFAGQYSDGFNPETDLERIGVVNQTTMLASDTQAIADYLKQEIIAFYQAANDTEKYFANTRDTLCYATNDNQEATYALLKQEADFAVVAGGYNSSNTSHIVELCEEKLPTYFIETQSKILSDSLISHYNLHTHQEQTSENYIPKKAKTNILLTCGASCPDAIIEAILLKLLSYFDTSLSIEEVLKEI